MATTFKVTASSLNMRSGAGTSYKVVGSISKGTKITTSSSKKVGSTTWYKTTSGGKTGWVSGKYLSKVSGSDSKTNKNTNKESKKNITKATKAKDKKKKGSKTEKALLALLNSTNSKTEKVMKMTNRFFGAPHQFMDSVDLRVYEDSNLGKSYSEKIMAEAPIVCFIPVLPKYLPDVSHEQKDIIKDTLGSFFSNVEDSDRDKIKKVIDDVLGDDEVMYFDTVPKYGEYTYYVNALCRVCAIYLGIGNNKGPNGTRYKYYNWENYTWFDDYERKGTEKKTKNVFEKVLGKAKKVAKEITDDLSDSIFGKYNYVQFYANSDMGFSEEFSNDVGDSQLSSLFGTAEDYVKEFNFLTGAGATQGFMEKAASLLSGGLDALSEIGGKGNFIDRLLGNANQVIDGANLVFPQIWKDFKYGKGTNITIELKSPYGTKEAIYLNIIVPLMHLLALVLPRYATPNSFNSPFLVKAFCLGMFSYDMAIIERMSVVKGGQGAWTVDGLPTKIKVDLTLQELYSNLSMNKTTQVVQFFKNQGLINFLAVTCGVNVTAPNIVLKTETIVGVISAVPKNLVEGIGTTIKQTIAEVAGHFYMK